MRSVRLDEEMDRRVRRAAEMEGISVSEFIRRATGDRADRTLSSGADERLTDVVGVIEGRDDQGRRTGEAFTDALLERRRAKR